MNKKICSKCKKEAKVLIFDKIIRQFVCKDCKTK